MTDQGWTPSWYRVLDSEGKKRYETSDEEEARSMMRTGDRIERLHARPSVEYAWLELE